MFLEGESWKQLFNNTTDYKGYLFMQLMSSQHLFLKLFTLTMMYVLTGPQETHFRKHMEKKYLNMTDMSSHI